MNWTTRCILVCSLFWNVSCDSHRQTQNTINSFNLNPHETLYAAFPDTPASFDWNLSRDATSSVIETNIMRGLTNIEMSSDQVGVVPDLAEKWEMGGEGSRYTFKLRHGIKWTDGVDLKCKQFVDSFKRLFASNSSAADEFFVIKGAKNYHEGKDKNFSDVGVSCSDEQTLVVSLRESLSHFPALMAHHSVFPVRQDLIEKFGEKWASPENIVTLGTFKISNHQDGKFLILKKDDDDAGGKTTVKNIVFHFGVDTSTAIKLMASNEINVYIDIPFKDLKGIHKKEELVYTPLLDLGYLAFDIRQKPLSNPVFRRALAMAIDRDEFGNMSNGSLHGVSGIIPPGLVGYESNRGMRFDPVAAKELLKHSGFGDVDKYDPYFLAVSAPWQSVAENIRDQLKQNIGLSLKIIKEGDDVPKNAPVIHFAHWMAEVPDPHDFLALFLSDVDENHTGWKNKNYDQFVKQSAQVESPEAREKLLSHAQHLLTEAEMPVIPLFARNQYGLISKKVKHFPLNPMGLIPLKGVEVQ